MASIVNSSSQDIIASYVSNIAYNDGVLNLPMTIFIIICSVVSINKLFGDLNPLGRSVELLNKFFVQEGKRNISVNEFIDEYNELHVDDDNDAAAGGKKRNTSYTTLVNAYYELATLFYEWGWGQSFHFAYQLKGESFKSAIARHEYFLAGKLGVAAGDNILDVGCGNGMFLYGLKNMGFKNVIGIDPFIENNIEYKINDTEKMILEKMINNPGKIFSREDISILIDLEKERSVDVIITRLRKKIEIEPKNPKFLQTIRGTGYVLWIE